MRAVRKTRVDPVLSGAPPFPHQVGEQVNVMYDASPWSAKIHRVSVDQTTCSVRYNIDGSIEPSVSPSRILNPSQALPSLQPIPEAADVALTDEATAAVVAAPVETEEVTPTPVEEQMPLDDPTFTKRSSIAALNRAFTKIMKARLRRLKQKCKLCCGLREVPYFAAEMSAGALRLKLVHGTVQLTRQCNLSEWKSIKAVDQYLHLSGELLGQACRISEQE